jgi:FtsH-binding integral membrane protein
MSNFDRNYASATTGAGGAIAVDAGLRAYMIRVYNYMVAGVGLTGVVAWLTFEAAVAANADGAILQLTSFGRAMFAAM